MGCLVLLLMNGLLYAHSHSISKSPSHSGEMLQARNVTGKVTSEDAPDGLPGVNVLLKGTNTGTVTDVDGNYTIEVSSNSATLVFSFVGYLNTEVVVGDRSVININLLADVQALDELVVIGYGSQKRSDLTGSISSVDPDQFEGRNISSLEEGLQGQAPGVQVVQGSGQPGGRTIVRIRGQNSILGGGDPLYVIDGVPVTSFNDGNTSILSTINPGDIESIEILKDASATAIYGARGGNGVILITTKRGKQGQHVTFESTVGISEVIKTLDVLDSNQFVRLANERSVNDGVDLPFPNPNDVVGTNTNWQDEIFQTALVQNYTINFSGGGENTNYFASGNYLDQEGTIIGTGFSRGSFRLNLDQKVSERFSFSTQMYASRSVSDRTETEAFNSIISNAIGMPPVDPPFDDEGNPTPGEVLLRYPFSPSAGDNPVIEATEILDKLTATRILANIRNSYRITDDLSYELMLGADIINRKQDEYASRKVRGNTDGSGGQTRSEATKYIVENLIKYKKTISTNHQLDATGGFTWETFRSDFLSGSAEGFVSDDLLNNSLQAGERFGSPQTGVSEWDLLSYLGRVNYTFLNRYLVTLTGRWDGSSRFGEGNKWGFFPSLALAWRVSDENFMSSSNTISNLKLRFSWGQSGNQAIDPFQSLQRFSPQELVFGESRAKAVGFAPSNLGNPDLKWETTENINLGFDIGLIDQRLRISLDLYHKETTDLLALVNLPPTSGFSTNLQNIGSMKNQGIELSLGADIFGSDKTVAWDVNFNISSNKNEVIELAGGADVIAPAISFVGSAHILREGEPLSSFFAVEENGLTEDGLISYVDQNGDGDINNSDRVILGNPYPDFIFGFTSHVNYKRFDFDVFVQGEQGRDLWNANLYYSASSFFRGVNQITAVENRWTPDNPNPNAPYPKATSGLNLQWSDRFIEDASYLRLKSIKISYNLPVDRLPINSARVFVSGQNLLTITDYSWYNPDVNAAETGDLRIGVDFDTYPISKTVMFGINIGF